MAFLALVDRLAVLPVFLAGLALGDRLAVDFLAVDFLVVFFVVAISFGSSMDPGTPHITRRSSNRPLGRPERGSRVRSFLRNQIVEEQPWKPCFLLSPATSTTFCRALKQQDGLRVKANCHIRALVDEIFSTSRCLRVCCRSRARNVITAA